MIRIHNAEFPVRRWSRQPIIQKNLSDRPEGLWYSINNDWKRFCIESDNLQWIGNYNYNVNISNANILKINSLSEVRKFAKVYGEVGKYTTYINWANVAMNFDGIEVQDYNTDFFADIGANWFYCWDCASGCIWNLKNVKLKLYEQKRT